ncbi:MAG: hypothetical protein ACP5HH_01440 [Fervidicoccaceae archaeon]
MCLFCYGYGMPFGWFAPGFFLWGIVSLVFLLITVIIIAYAVKWVPGWNVNKKVEEDVKELKDKINELEKELKKN